MIYKELNINNSIDTQMEAEKDIFLKTKEKNNRLAQFIEELNKIKNKENKNMSNLKNLYNMDETNLMKILNFDSIN